MKNENMPHIENLMDNEIVDIKITDLVEAFKKCNDPQFVRQKLEKSINLIYAMGFATGKYVGVTESQSEMFKQGKEENDTLS